jgi:hypothetical protein
MSILLCIDKEKVKEKEAEGMTRKHKKQNRYANAVGVTGDPFSLVGKRFQNNAEKVGETFTKFDNAGQVVEDRIKSKKKRATPAEIARLKA